MTNLQCSVQSCASNQQGCCCQHAIKVQGKDAHCAASTCCQSFFKKGEGEVSNSTHYTQPNPALDVYCTAADCRYNDGARHCTAANIEITGGTPDLMHGTQCSTFEKR